MWRHIKGARRATERCNALLQLSAGSVPCDATLRAEDAQEPLADHCKILIVLVVNSPWPGRAGSRWRAEDRPRRPPPTVSHRPEPGGSERAAAAGHHFRGDRVREVDFLGVG